MSHSPIFADVFADQWEKLPPVLRTHYANRPYSHDRVTVEGHLDIHIHPLLKPLAPLMALMGMLTPWTGKAVPCTVQFRSQPDGNAFIFDRRFHFTGHKSYQFRSELLAKSPHEVMEVMRCGVGWRCGYALERNRVVLTHKGYALRWFGLEIPLPGAGLIVGRGEAWEEATSDNTFSMYMALRHPLFGPLYHYSGTFKVVEIALG